MIEETLHHRGSTVVRRLVLTPGEATRWHRDPFHRISIVFKGAILAIEFRDGHPSEHVKVTPGQVDWDEPSDRIHRAVNIGGGATGGTNIFFLTHPDGDTRVVGAYRMPGAK